MSSLLIKSGEKDYSVIITETDNIEEYFVELKNKYKNILIIIDSNVKKLYPNILDYENYNYLEIEATEEQKTFDNLNNVIDYYQKMNLQKKDVIVAIGGGIIQDIVAFTSKIYYRGIDYFLFPTTLLSMSDSSIGAKCGINYKDRKNQIAVFNSPVGIVQNIPFLKTLKQKDIFSGVGEIVKLLITSSESDYEVLERDILKCIKEEISFEQLILMSLESKKVVIEEDEYESDLRRVLNYGHTFGHAVESLSNFAIPHGIAVLWGMDIVNYIALRRGFTTEDVYNRINKLLLSIYNITEIKIDDYDHFIDYVSKDKKAEGKAVNIVYPEKIGSLKIKKIDLDDKLIKDLKQYYSG